MSELLLRTPLYDLLSAIKGAKFVPFSGWQMPIQFQGILQEHQSVRQSAGLFDISHMGKFLLKGENLIAQLQRLVPSDLSTLKSGQAQYTVLLNEQAGIIDDLIVYYYSDNEIFLIVNAATLEKDRLWLNQQLNSSCQLQDLSTEKVLLALQGPAAQSYLQPLLDENLDNLKFFEHHKFKLKEQEVFVARTGYTGEDGFEIMTSPELAEDLYQQLTSAGVNSCGLGARDTLRLEAAMSLYGQDIDESTTPLEAGLGFVVHLDRKDDFIGRAILEKQKSQGVKRRLVGLIMSERNIARHDHLIFEGENQVGKITSGTFSPTLAKPIALGYVPTELSKLGQNLSVEIRGNLKSATVVKKPFYKR